MALSIQSGLYVITDPALSTDMVADVENALMGGATLVQYRNKQAGSETVLQEARELVFLCETYGVPLLINDDVELALESGAAGVHLGQDDTALEAARNMLGDKAVIGISCYNNLERAIEMEKRGASYIALGRFFPSSTKPHAVQATPDLLMQARQLISVPVVAIGGITAQNGATLIDAGADLLAVIHGVFGQPDIRSASEAISALFPE